MKRILLFLLCFGAFQGMAQKIYPWDGYIFPFCTDENPYGITYDSGTKGKAAFPKSTDVGCLRKTPGPVWYYMLIDQPGDLLIYIEQHSIEDEMPLDVDFACWGPFQADSKHDFLQKLRNSYKLEVESRPSHRPPRGDHSHDLGDYPFHNLVDCSYDPAGTEWCYIPEAKTGEWYLLLITNYSRKPGKIHFERVNDKSTATTNCDMTLPVVINPVPKGLRQIDDRTSAVCLYDDKALVTIELETEDESILSKQCLKKTKVVVYANGKTYNARLSDEHFECEIDILQDTTAYYAVVECPDPEFTLQTEQHYLVRSNDCDPERIPTTQGETVHAGSLNVADLKRGDKPIEVNFQDKDDYRDINLDDYEVEVDSKSIFVEEVTVGKKGNQLQLTPKLRGDWCDCFLPEQLDFRVRLIPKSYENGATPIVMPVTIGVDRQSSWISGCQWVLVALAALLVLLCYLRAILRKRRFKKNATITPVYYDRYGEEVDDGSGQRLRKTGFAAWFARWFVPGTEKRTLSFESPEAGTLKFSASESVDAVEIPKNCIDPEIMDVDGYDPECDSTPSRPVRLASNGRINVKKSNGTRDGYLYFTPGCTNDGTGYRLFLGVLIFVDIVAVIALTVVIIRGLI